MRDEALPRGGRRAPAPPPALHGELVRARLLEQIGRRFSVPVTVVVAGAGFGKSTLLAQAIRGNQADPCGIDAWVSCEPGDGDAAHLAQAILASLGRRSERRDPIDRVLDALGDLAPLDVCVVLDDLHEVSDDSSGAAFLAELVKALPPHAHVVLAGRQRPPVPLARRRAAGQVVELGLAELAFTDAEAGALAHLLGHESSRVDDLAGLAGWPSLIRLSLSAPLGAAPQFLWEEIVAALGPADRTALLALATLGWGTAADVEDVAGEGPVDLDHLSDTVPLVHRGGDGWFGVHNLWEDAVERIFPWSDRRGPQQRALALFERRGETLRTGWRAVRWADADALRTASLLLVGDTFGALPIDTAARWLATAPAAARGSPQLELLELALLHARRYDDPRLSDRIDVVVDQFVAGGDQLGAAVAIALGAVVAHTCGDEPRLLSLDARARALPADVDVPILQFLHGAMTAAMTSLRGDVKGALTAVTGMSFDEVPSAMTELVIRLHAYMLSLDGRADEAVGVAAALLDSPSPYVRTIPSHARWLAGDPSAFAGGHFDTDPGPGTNERYHFYHATYGTAVAASFGDRDTIEQLRPVIEKFATGLVDSRDRAMIAFATALRHIVDHDEVAARRVIGDHVESHPEDRLADAHLRRSLAVAYVCDERIRGRWQAAELGPTHARQRAVAEDLLAMRSGRLPARRRLAAAETVLTALPLQWSVELAARAVAAGAPGGKRLALGLADLAPTAVRAELHYAAEHGDKAIKAGAATLLAALPDASRPTVTISVLGELEISVGDELVEVADLRRRRVRALLELLVLAGPLRRDRLADLMWPDLDAGAAGRNLRVTLSRLRAVLEPGRATGAGCAALRIDGDTIALAPPPCVEVDLWQFRHDVDEAEAAARVGDPTGVLNILERAAARWRGDPFSDIDAAGDIAGGIEEVRRALADTALRLGELQLVAGRFDDAAAWAQRVTKASPYDERAHRLAIAAHLQRRDRDAVAHALHATRHMLGELGVDPEPGTRMLLRQAEVYVGRIGTAA
jgi:LuxR family maltose regulon positive regulatory protein